MIDSIWSLVSVAPKCGMRPDEMPRMPYCWLAGTPMLIQLNSSDSPLGGGNWLFTSPSVRLGPNAPPPMVSKGAPLGASGLLGSKYDHPRVWQRAQLFMNRSWPSVTDWVVSCHCWAAASVSCFS